MTEILIKSVAHLSTDCQQNVYWIFDEHYFDTIFLAVECQTRWIRLRERFSKETRQIEVESKSGSGASQRKGFALYEQMKFLKDHVQRRRTFTNISQKKDKENVITKVPNSNLNVVINQPTVATTSTTRPVFHSISLNSLTNCATTVKPRNCGLLNIMESTAYKPQSVSETPNRIEKTEESSSESSQGSIRALSQGFSTPSIPSQRDRCYSTPKKRQKSESDDIEKSFLSLSTTIADKIRNSNTQTEISNSNKSENDPDVKFGELIGIELKQLPEDERKEKKRRILDILWN